MRLCLAALLLAPALIGCATANIEPAYRSRAYARPGAPAGVVFVSVPPGEVPIDYHGTGATQYARATRSLNDFLGETVSAELRAVGFAAASSEQQSKGVLHFAFTKTRIAVNMWGKFTADVGLHGELKDRAGRAAWSADFVGTASGTTWAPGLPGDFPQKLFNQALAAALDQFAPSFVGDAGVAALLGGAAPAAAAKAATAPADAAPAMAQAPAAAPAPAPAAPVEIAGGPQASEPVKHGRLTLTLSQAAAELLP